MDRFHSPVLTNRFRWASRVGAVVALTVAGLVMLGWVLDEETLKTVFPGMVAMNPGGTAMAFLLGGVGLLALQDSASPRSKIVGRTLAAAVTLLSVLRLSGYVIGWDEGPDRWIFREQLEIYEIPKLMAHNTAACFLLCCVAL